MSSVIGGGLPSIVVTSNIISSTTNTTDASAQQSAGNLQTTPELQPSEAQLMLLNFWQKQLQEVQNLDVNDFKIQELPLARIKKIMKMDEDVKMISAEAPLLFAKAAQMFITELSLRAWIHTEDNKRRTLQRNDIATAITKFDQFDFLIDIVPREEIKPARRPTEESRSTGEAVQYFYSVPQQQQQQQTQQAQTVTVVGQSTPQASSSNLQPNQVVVTPQGQIVQFTSNNQAIGSAEGGQQIIQLSQPQQQNQQQNAVVINSQPQQQQQSSSIVFNPQQETQQQQTSTINQTILQQLISNSGTAASEIHSVQINPDGQVQFIKVPSNATDSHNTNQQQGQQQQQTVVRLGSSDGNQQMFEIPTTT